MQANVCFAYPWATFGGCERVLLNRALAFKKYLPEIHIDFCFFHDSGGLEAFGDALDRYDLRSKTSIVSSLQKKYDIVSLIDCPQAIEICTAQSQKYVVECHTGYSENRRYLKHLPDSCEKILVPSLAFSSVIKDEFPDIESRLGLLRNFIPWDVFSMGTSAASCLPDWNRKPILFFGRLDLLKDPLTLLDAFKILESSRPNEFILVFCGPQTPEINVGMEIDFRGLEGSAIVLPPVPFYSASLLLYSVAEAGGIFISPSKSESFGLSAAEAISLNLPVLLSNIEPHLDLVRGHEEFFTFPVGDSEMLATCIEKIFGNYKNARDVLPSIRESFSAIKFIDDWNESFGRESNFS